MVVLMDCLVKNLRMNLSRIKNLVKENGDKVILVENDEPEVVVMSFREYERISANHSGAAAPAHEPETRPHSR